MRTFDVIVVGLGPGGSTTAYNLAKNKHRVLGLEKYNMPRYKACRGCLSRKIESISDFKCGSVIENEIDKLVLTFRGQGDIHLVSPNPIAYQVNRATFDQNLVECAAAAGAELHDGEGVTAIETLDDGYVVSTCTNRYRCRYLVGADGANSIVRRYLNYCWCRNLVFASDHEFKIDASSIHDDTIVFDIGVIPFGYGWLLPDHDHWTPLKGRVKDADGSKSRYRVFLEELDVRIGVHEEQRKGYRIPIFSGDCSDLIDGRSLVVGDAAALVDPFLGEGIYYAIRSGQIAADTIDRVLTGALDELSIYQNTVAKEFFNEFEAAYEIAQFMYKFSKPVFRLLKSRPSVAESLLDVIKGKLSYVEMRSGLQRYIKRGQISDFSFD